MKNIINYKLLIVLVIQIFFNLSFSSENRCKKFIESQEKKQTIALDYGSVNYKFNISIPLRQTFGTELKSAIINDSKNLHPTAHRLSKNSVVEIVDNDGNLLLDNNGIPFTYKALYCLYDNDGITIGTRRGNHNLIFNITDFAKDYYYINKILESFGGKKKWIN